MRILAFEFSSSLRSAALIEEGRVVCRAQEELAQSVGPAALTRDVLGQAGLGVSEVGCIAVGLGPGSYTGVRVSIAVAQGWELARGVLLVGRSSVECMVWRAWLEGRHGDVTVVVDAQRGDFYAERYLVTQEGVAVRRPLAIVGHDVVRAWAEEGSMLLGADLEGTGLPVCSLRAEAGMLGVLAWGATDFVKGEELAPIYLRETRFTKMASNNVIWSDRGDLI